LDTRSKIVPVEEARRRAEEWRAAGETVRAVIGYFDPLLPAYVALLREQAAGARLIAVVATPDDAYLEERARAELAAALDFVDAVVTGSEAEGLGEGLVINEAELRRQFIEYVRAKY
jgi:hypothetical protein